MTLSRNTSQNLHMNFYQWTVLLMSYKLNRLLKVSQHHLSTVNPSGKSTSILHSTSQENKWKSEETFNWWCQRLDKADCRRTQTRLERTSVNSSGRRYSGMKLANARQGNAKRGKAEQGHHQRRQSMALVLHAISGLYCYPVSLFCAVADIMKSLHVYDTHVLVA